jgi:5-(carboxyamino)imidazole ribonucleotide synthase
MIVDGKPHALEVAPRVHNSGHWTMDGSETPQFENHVRAVLGFPLGSTATHRPYAMVNLLGAVPERKRLLAIPGVRLHHYEKEAAPGRKLGHVNVIAPEAGELAARLAAVEALLES